MVRTMPEKKCGCCETIKSTTEFSKSKNRGLGIDVYCKQCRSDKRKLATIYSERTLRLRRIAKLIPAGLCECMDCKQVKPIADFRAAPKYQSGYHPRCKECDRILDRNNRRNTAKNRTTRDIPNAKPCPKCHQVKLSSEFHRDNGRKDGLTCHCKACMNSFGKKFRKTHTYKPSTIEKKRCSSCDKTKKISEFRLDQYSKDGYRCMCLMCERIYAREWAMSHPTNKAERHRCERYGITKQQYDEMLKNQNGVCYICGKPEHYKDNKGRIRALSIDHEHREGGIVRSLLCSDCNTAIAMIHEDENIAIKIAEYIVYFRSLRK